MKSEKLSGMLPVDDEPSPSHSRLLDDTEKLMAFPSAVADEGSAQPASTSSAKSARRMARVVERLYPPCGFQDSFHISPSFIGGLHGGMQPDDDKSLHPAATAQAIKRLGKSKEPLISASHMSMLLHKDFKKIFGICKDEDDKNDAMVFAEFILNKDLKKSTWPPFSMLEYSY